MREIVLCVRPSFDLTLLCSLEDSRFFFISKTERLEHGNRTGHLIDYWLDNTAFTLDEKKTRTVSYDYGESDPIFGTFSFSFGIKLIRFQSVFKMCDFILHNLFSCALFLLFVFN